MTRSGLPDLKVVFLSRNVIANASTGNPTFVEIFSEIRPASFPTIVTDFYVILFMQGVIRPITIEGQIWATWPSLQPLLWSATMQLVVPPKAPRPETLAFTFGALGVDKLIVQEPGDLQLRILFDGVEMSRQSISVHPVTPLTASSQPVMDI
jgi:hypothetical protein